MGEVLKRFPSEESDQNVSELFGDSAAQLLQEHIGEKNALPTRKRGPKVAPGKAVSVADLTKTSSASSSSKTPTVTPATDSDESDSSDDSTLLESEEEDVCQICFGDNPPGDVESIDWEGCKTCDDWFHAQCLDGVNINSVCRCINV